MNKRLIFVLICFVMCLFISTSAIYAADTDNKTLSSNEDEPLQKDIQENVLEATPGSFTELRNLIEGASDGEEIKLTQDYAFDESNDAELINGIPFSKKITIDGQGHTIDGMNKARIFSVGGTYHQHVSVNGVVLKNINFVNARNTAVTDKNYAFGAVEFYGNGSIINCNFSNNYAFCSAALAIGFGANIQITGCNFINNTGYGQGGGAIRLKTEVDSLVIYDCLFKDNFGKSYGGAVHSDMGKNNMNTLVEKCIFINNTAATGAGALFFETPGGVVKNSEFYNNSAPIGGAIYWNGVNGNVSTSKFIHNNATNGGAIYFSGRSTSNLTTSIFTNNSASENGGAVYFNGSAGSALDKCSFNHNVAKGDGGAIYCIGEFFTLTNSNFTGDVATNGGSLYLNIGAYVYNCKFERENATNDGGGIYLYAKLKEGFTLPEGVRLGVYSSNFTNCHADRDGGAGYVYSDYGVVQDTILQDCTAGHDGGAGYIYGSYGRLVDSQLINNFAQGNGGALYWAGSNGTISSTSYKRNRALGDGGAVYWSGRYGNISNTNFTENHAVTSGSDGGSIMWIGSEGTIEECYFNVSTAKGNGGVMYISGNNTNITKSVFQRYNATNGGALYVEGNNVRMTYSSFEFGEAEFGGAIYLNGEDSYLGYSNLTRNHAKKDGGIIYVNGDKGTITESKLDYSYAAQSGGAVYINGNYTVISNSNLTYNNASTANGGSIFIKGEKTNVTNSLFRYCFAKNGAGIYVEGSDARISDSIFMNNGANPQLNVLDTKGGSIYITGHNTLVKNSNFTQTSGGAGGAIYITGDGTNITDSGFRFTTAHTNGGAIYVGGTNTRITDSLFQFNNATNGNGGAIYINGNRTYIESNFDHNFAKNGGAIYVSGNNNNITDSNFTITMALNGNGGAIYAGGVNTTINNIYSNISNAIRMGPGNVGNGGAVYIAGNGSKIIKSKFERYNATDNGGAVYVQGNNANISESSFEYGEATLGGAIFINGNKTTLYKSNLTHNHAKENGGVIYVNGNEGLITDSKLSYSYAGKSGGAVFINGQNNKITKSVLNYNNASTEYGGSIYIEGNNNNVTYSLFEFCTSTKGGAIYIDGANAKISYSNFTQNGINPQLNITEGTQGGTIYIAGHDALITNNDFKRSSAHDGGIIYLAGNNGIIRNSNFTMSAAYNNGGTIYVSGNNSLINNSRFSMHNASGYGGSIYIEGKNNNVTYSSFTLCTASKGGAIYIDGENAKVAYSHFIRNGMNPQLKISDDTQGGTVYIAGNNALITDDDFRQSSAREGGIIYLAGNNGNIKNSNFTMSVAYKDGGAIYVSGNHSLIDNSKFSLHNASNYGGAIYAAGNDVNITHSQFTITTVNNTEDSRAITAGGAIYIGGNYSNIKDSTFNITRAASGNGGAVYVAGSDSTLENVNFTISLAIQGNGGAIYIEGKNAQIINAVSNVSQAIGSKRGPVEYAGLGGTVFISGENATIKDSDFKRYNATFKGGSVYVEGNNASIINSAMEFGEAKYGGAIYIDGDNTKLSNSNLSHNHAKEDGGVIYVKGDNANITKSNLTYSYSQKSGGAIYVNGEYASISDSILQYNNATDSYGGSIYINGNNTNITGSLFEYCTSENGGAIYVNGTNASIINSEFNRNKVSIVDGDGGTIFIEGTNALISGSKFTQSNARDGGFIYIKGSNTNITKSSFDRSVAYRNGGAIFIGGENTTVSESNFTRHNATYGGAVYVNGSNTHILSSSFSECNAKVDGGVIFMQGHNASVISCNITKYNATRHGGALYVEGNHANITKSSFEFGEALDGGAVFIQGGNVYVSESNFTHNHARENGGIIYINGSDNEINNSKLEYSYANASGGAIYIEGVNTVVNNCNMSFNNATQGQGGSIYIKGNHTNITSSDFKFCTSTAGGAIYINGFEALIKSSNFTQNRVSSSTGDGGSIYIEGNQSKILYSDFKMSNSYNGGIIYIEGVNANISGSKFNSSVATNYGGAIYVGGENATIENSTFMRHNATKGGAIYVAGVNAHILTSNFTQCNAKEDGGVIFIQGDNATVIGCIIEKYTATAHGGALYVEGHNSNITNSTFTFGEASYGGAAYIEGENAYIENSTFARNHAINDGGIVYIKGNNVKINTSRLSYSYANASGGAIYIDGVNATINDCNMSYNNATRGYGGSIYIKGRNATINASDFKYCISTSGGAIYVDGIGARILESNFTSNRVTSGGNGGTVYIAGNETFISKSNFTKSNAQNGGFIYIKGNNANISESSFTYSAANDGGGALYIEGVNASMYSSLFFRNNATRGGAVYINGENTNVVDSNFSQGHAGSDAGAIYLGGVNTYVYKSVFDHNSATYDGGAMYNQGGTAKIWYSNFTNNYVKSSGTVHGGAIYWDGGSLNDLIFGCYFVNNSASHTNNNVDAYGGAIYCGRGNDTTYGAQIRNSTFINNSAARHGGAIYWDLADNGIMDNNTFIKNNAGSDAGAIYAGNDNLKGSNLTISNNHFSFNYAGIRGGAISIQFNSSHIINNTFYSDCSSEGGAVYSRNQKAHNTEIVNCNFTNCTTHAPIQRTTTTAHGGAIFLNTELFTIINCRFTDCYTYKGREGGAIFLTANANDMIIINSTFINCTATQDGNNSYGGAISVHALRFNIYNSSFENCTAVDGGAIYLGRGSNHPDNLYNLNFTSNVATRYGGAIYITKDSERVTLDKAVFNGNNASQGSAIYTNGKSDIKMSNIVFGANRADADELIINVTELTYYPNNVNITIFFKGKDNIANAIWNENGVNALKFKNITYQMFKNNKLTNVTLADGNDFVKPKLGAQESSYGENIYQDNLEDAQIINVVITDVTDSENTKTVESISGQYTDIYGNLTRIMSKLSVGKYSIYAEHPQDEYYTGIYATQNFEVKDLFNVTKSPQVTQINKDDLINYTITIKNIGEISVSNITITENLPKGYVIVNFTDKDKWTRTGSVFTYIGSLDSQETIELIITFNTTESGKFLNNITVGSNETLNMTVNATDYVDVRAPNLEVNKTSNVTSLDVNQLINYTITIKNTGNTNVSDIKVHESFLNGFKVLGCSDGWTYDEETNVFTYNGDKLLIDATLILNITFNATSNGTFSNKINVTSDIGHNVSATADNVTVYNPNMTVVKVANMTSVDVNHLINYTITIKNTGDRNISDIKVYDQIPEGFRYVSNSPYWKYNSTTKVFTYTGGNLTVKGTLTLNITFNVTVNGTFKNTVNVTSDIGRNITASSDNTTVYNPNMTVVKVANMTSVDVNHLINYTITIKNTGDRNISDIKVYDQIPDGFVVVNNSPKWTYDGANGFVYSDVLKVGETITLNITFNATKPGNYSNTVNVTSDMPQNITNTTADNVTVYNPNMTVMKLVNVTKLDIGNLIKYTIIINNSGDCNLSDIKVYEEIPDGFVLKEFSSGWSNITNNIFKYGKVLTPGNVTELIVIFNVTRNGTFINNITVSSNRTNNITTFSNQTRVYAPNMTVIKTSNVTGDVYVGDLINFTINITNTGDRNISNIKIVEQIPHELEYVSNSANWTYDKLTKTFTYIKGNLTIGQSLILNITFRAINNGTFKNTVVVISDMENKTNSSEEITTLPDVKLNITKTINVTKANVGDLINFTIVVTNNGLSNATGVNVTDKLIDLLKFEKYIASQGDYNNITGLWAIGNITSGRNVTLTIIAKVITNGTISNLANVTSNENNTVINTTSDNVTAYPVVDLKVNKTVNVTVVYVGSLVNYTITVTNIGLSNATGVNVNDLLDKRLKFISYISKRGTYDNVTGIWTIGNLNVGEVLTLNITARVLVNGTIPNAVNITCNENDTNLTNNNGTSDNITALPDVKLNITKTVNVTKANVGDMVNFTITVTNNGLSNATGVNVTDKLIDLLKFQRYVASQGTYNNLTGLWSIGNITSKANVTLTIFARIIANGTVSNVANVTSNENTTVINTTSDNVTALPVIDLKVNKTVNVTSVHVGGLVNYTITVTNIGLSNATGVNVTDLLDKRLKFISYNSTRGNYDNKTGVWTIGNLNVGEVFTLNITARVLVNGTIPNVVNVTGNENDTNLTNNNGTSDNITAFYDVKLNITKSINVTKANVGDMVNFTITVKNNGLSNATGVNVTDKLIDLLKFERYVASQGTYDNLTGLWSIGNLTAGGNATLTIFAKIISNGTISNLANVTSNENTTMINTTSDNVTAYPVVDLKVNKTVNVTVVYVGSLVNYTITVTNIGLSNATGVNVTDLLDKRLKFISCNAARGTYNNITGLWAIGNLNVGEVLTLNITARVLVNGTIPNAVNVAGNENDTNLTNNNGTSDNITALPDVKLNITKTVNVTKANVGDVINFTITVTNNGLSNATGVNVTDKLIDLLKFERCVVSAGSYNNVTGLWSIGNITSGANVTLTIFARIIANGTVSNVANVTANENNTVINTTSDNVTALPVVDLKVNKTVNLTVVYVGGLVNYTITVTNIGLSNATGVNVTDLLDKRLKFISYNATKGTYDNATGVWSIGNLNIGEVLTLNITAKVLVNGTIPNSVNVTGNENDTNLTNNNGTSDNLTALPDVKLNITKTVNVTKANVGDVINFTITVINNGLSNATGVNVTDKLIGLLEFVNYVSSQGNYNNITGLWSVGNITSGKNLTLTIFAKVISNGTITNLANVTSNENKTIINTTSNNVTALPVVDLKVNKTINITDVHVGDLVNYTITVTNIGLSNATGVNVTDLLDKRLEFISYNAARGTYNNITGLWAIGKLNVGEVLTLNITAIVLVNGTIPNSVNVTGNENDTNLTNNNATSDNITALPDVKLNITKVINVTKANVGDLVNFTITVTNKGLSNASDVNVTDKLISLLEFQKAIASQGSYNDLTGLWSVGNITSGKNVTLTIIAKVISNGTISNVANVTSNENTTVINTTSDNVTAYPVVDLKVNKTVNITVVYVGSLVNYTITVTNIGLSNATCVNVNDLLDKRLKFISYSATRGTYDNVTGVWSVGNLNVGEVLTLNITAKVLVNGTIPNTVNVTGNENDTNLTNNNGTSDNITALPDVKLNITKTVNVTTVKVGDLVNFTITVTNNGLSNATGVNVTDKLISLLEFQKAIASQGSYNNLTGLWSVGNITSGKNVTLTIIAKVIGNGTISNLANVTSNENDTVINTTSENVTANPYVDLTINKTINTTTAKIYETVTYTITVKNIGLSNATGVKVTDILDKRLKLISTDGDYDEDSGVWTIGNLNANQTVTLKIVVKIMSNGTIPNMANVTSNENDTNKSNNVASSDNLTALPVVNLTVIKKSNITDGVNVSVGDQINFTITVTNHGPSNATDVVIRDVLDEAFEFVNTNGTYTGTRNIIWTIPFIQNGTSVSVWVVVEAVKNGFYSNSAIVNSTENTNGSKNGTDVVILPAVNISLIKTSNVTGNVSVGDLVNYTIVITNNGPSRATNINITDVLPEGVEYVSSGSNITGVTGTNTINTIKWTISSLNNGHKAEVWVLVRVMVNGTITNTAYVNSTENTTGTHNSTTVNVNPVVNLTIVKTSNVTGNAKVGDIVKFTINVTNHGPSNATDVVVVDILNDAFEFVSATGSYRNEGQKVTLNVGNLANGTSVCVNVAVRILIAGNFTNTASVNATQNGPKTNGTTNITTETVETPISLDTRNITYGEPETIKVTLPGDVTGYVNITVGNKTYPNRPISDGVVELTLDDLAGGEYNVTVIYSGDNKYHSNSTKGTFKVSPATPRITIEVADIYYGQIEVLNVTVNAPGYVNVTVNGTSKIISLENGVVTGGLLMAAPTYNGKATWNIVELAVGYYTAFAEYLGNENYTSVNISSSFNVLPLKSQLIVKAEDIYVGEDAIINVEVSQGATGNVTLIVDGETYIVNLTDGRAKLIVSGLKAGLKNVSATYNGDEVYLTSENKTSFTVKKLTPPMDITSKDIYVGDDETITVTVPGDATGQITIKVDGKTYTADVKNGKAIFTIPGLKAGKYDIAATYSGDDKYLSVTGSGKFNVLKHKPDIKVDAPDIDVGDDGKITVTLPDDATGKVTIEVEGKRYTADVVGGKAVFSVPGLAAGTHAIKVYYSGDDKYCSVNTTGDITVHDGGNDNKHLVLSKTKMHNTANPILMLLIGVLILGFTELKRFKK